MIDEKVVFEALRKSTLDPYLAELGARALEGEGFAAHAERVEQCLDRRPRVHRLLAADLSGTGIWGYFAPLNRQLILDVATVETLIGWQASQPWLPAVLHELLHAAETVPLSARIARPRWWTGREARRADVILLEGVTDQLTAKCAELSRVPGTPFLNYSREYRDLSGAVWLIALAVAKRTERTYDSVIVELWQQPAGRRRAWLAELLNKPTARLDSLLIELAEKPARQRVVEIRDEIMASI